MTEPTQAQIDAVRKCLVGYHDWLPDEAIAAALTAAAQVGPRTDNIEIRFLKAERDELKDQLAALTAAAGVDKPEYEYVDGQAVAKSPTVATPPLLDQRALREAAIDATIERCAQVAEDVCTKNGFSASQTAIVDAIRALKDKP